MIGRCFGSKALEPKPSGHFKRTLKLLAPMPSPFSVATLCETLNVTPIPDLGLLPVVGITTDTRSLQPGEVFLALRGETFDGHQFLSVAAQKGAIAAIVDCEAEIENPRIPLITVPNTLTAYQQLAHQWRLSFHRPVIAITGSVGKTTTKELLAAVLGQFGQVHKSQANFNNEIGVPKTLLQIKPDQHDFAVVEMGMRALGEIALLTQIAQPDIGIITNVGTAHIGRLGSEAAIAQAKCELLAEMPPQSIAILNYDNSRLMATAAGVWSGQTITYGLTGGDIHGQLLDPQTLVVNGQSLPLPLPGEHNASNYLAALAVAQALGLSWQPLQQGLSVEVGSGRSRQLQLANDILLLDETYNAGLESMLASLKLLAETPGKRRIAVLGTMKELGDRSPEFHAQVGARARQLGLDAILVLADEPAALKMVEDSSGSSAVTPVIQQCFSSHAELLAYLQDFLQPGDRYLFKASRAVALDRVVENLAAQFAAPHSASLPTP